MTDCAVNFSKPWHAQISAIVQLVKETGTFSASQWSQTLGAERARQLNTGVPDSVDSYFIAMLDSLLCLLNRDDPTLASELRDMTEAWRTAYLTTPHGHQVKLYSPAP